MTDARRRRSISNICILAFTILIALPPAGVYAGGKIGLYGIHMVPEGKDAKDNSRAGWGAGLHIVAPMPQVANIFAGVFGAEIVNLLGETVEMRDRNTGMLIKRATSQNYFRFYLGGQVGGHGNGFIRPHVGANLALIVHDIRTRIIIPDEEDPSQELSNTIYDDTKAVFGYDFTLGIDLNFSNTIALDGGVRYLRSLSVPEQLGGRSVVIYPQYFQIYLGVGISFQMIDHMSE